MSFGRRSLGLLAASLLSGFCAGPVASEPTLSERPVTFAALAGWADDDLPAAFTTFRRSCPTLAAIFVPACAEAERSATPVGAREFFERWFNPAEVTVGGISGFLTGYYEPELPGSLEKSREFPAPLLSMPDRSSAGAQDLPDRAAIEDGALDEVAKPLVWLDPVDAFVVHVQGSARISLAGGGQLRVGYAGRNGWPYTSVARVLAEKLAVPPSTMDANRLTAWLKANPDEARPLMRANRSYIFFALSAGETLGGPVGGAGVPLTAGRSVAVDRAAWPYGTPIWLEGELPTPDGGRARLARLTVAQDTGAAILGPARADLFVGSGAAAGAGAGLIRERVRFVVLRPRQIPRDQVAR